MEAANSSETSVTTFTQRHIPEYRRSSQTFTRRWIYNCKYKRTLRVGEGKYECITQMKRFFQTMQIIVVH